MTSSSLKPVTVRLPEEDVALAQQEAEALGISVGVFLRMLVRQSLRRDNDTHRRADALRRFSKVMAAEAQQQGLTEDDILQLTKRARKDLASHHTP